MPLLLDTGDGVSRHPGAECRTPPERTLDCGHVVELVASDRTVYAATVRDCSGRPTAGRRGPI